MKKLALLVFAMLIAGCAAPITFYSKTPGSTKPGKIQFSAQNGAYTTFALYEESSNCSGIQRVSFFSLDVNETIYVPFQKYLTFSAYIQFPGYPNFKYGSSMYTVPFESGELRVLLKYDSERYFTIIERSDDGIHWEPIENAIERQPSQPFLESGPWCSDQLTVSNK